MSKLKILSAALALLLPAIVSLTWVISSSTPELNKSISADALSAMYSSCSTAERWEICVQDKLEPLLGTISIPDVTTAVYEYERKNIEAKNFTCHEIMHDLGKRSARASSEVVTAMQPGQLGCQFGFQHGVIEQLIDDAPDIESALAICEPLVNDNSLPKSIVGNCYHGIGHGVANRNGNEFLTAFRECEKIEAIAIVNGCVTGVTMSWSNTYDAAISMGGPIPESIALAPKERQWEVCEKLTSQYARAGCTNFVAEKVTPSVENYKSFGVWCATKMKVLEDCLGGVGRIVGSRSMSNINGEGGEAFNSTLKVQQFCSAVASGLNSKITECLFAATRIRAQFTPSDTLVTELCSNLPAECSRVRTAWESAVKPRSEVTIDPTQQTWGTSK